MNKQLKAAIEIHRFLTKSGIPYAVIGGIALQYWGEPRFTRDVDVTVLVESDNEADFIKQIFSAFSPRVSNPVEFALKNRICLIKSREGVEIDISLGIPGYESDVISRSVVCKISSRDKVKVCSAEDLIIHKAIAGRPKDLSDIESIILRQGKGLDVDYIRKWLDIFTNVLEMEEIRERFESPFRQFLSEE